MSNTNNTTTGIVFAPLLFIFFLTLKLCNVIDWSWWWVTCPLWAEPCVVAVVLIVAGFLWLVGTAVSVGLEYWKFWK